MPEHRVSAFLWQAICRGGALQGRTVAVLEDCQRAVALDPDYLKFREDLVLALALTDDLAGAIENLQIFLQAATESRFSTLIERGKTWLEALQRGENPISQDMLDALWNE